MKELIVEIRKIISVKLLMWALDVIPNKSFKAKYAKFLKDNIMSL